MLAHSAGKSLPAAPHQLLLHIHLAAGNRMIALTHAVCLQKVVLTTAEGNYPLHVTTGGFRQRGNSICIPLM